VITPEINHLLDTRLIPVVAPYLKDEILDKVIATWKNYRMSPANAIEEFERQMAKILKVSHTLAVNSGTSALHLALKVLGVQSGDEVICPTFTYAATLNAIRYCGAIPIMVDSEEQTWNLCPDLLEQAIVDRKGRGSNLKAVIVVHSFGMPAQMDRILSICDAYKLPVIEDAAGALGSSISGRSVGTFGEIGVVSFNVNKILTTLGGGLMVTNNHNLFSRAGYLANQAKSNTPYYLHKEVGFNYRMNTFAAIVGLSQLPNLQRNVELKRAIYHRYRKSFNNIPHLEFIKEPDGYRTNRWMSTACMKNSQQLENIIHFMDQNNIEINYVWKPMHQQPAFNRFPIFQKNVANRLFGAGLCLPSSVNITDDEQLNVIETVKHFFAEISM